MAEAATVAAGDALSPAEQAYFESGGEETEGLVPDAPEEAAPGAETPPEGKDSPEPEGQQEAAPGDQKGKPRAAVPHGAFHAEREARKAAEATLATERQNFAKLQARLDLINEALGARQQQEEPKGPPDPNQDIFGAFDWAMKKIGELEGKVGETSQAAQATQAEIALTNAYRADALQFAREKAPDFGEAYSHLLTTRDRMLARQGYDEKERASIIVQEEKSLVARALQSGVSPAELVYGMAQDFGYRARENGNGQAAQEEKPAAAPDTITRTIEQIRKGQSAAKTLSTGGTAGDAPLTAEALLAMSDKEFAEFEEKLSPSEKRRLFG